MRAALPVLAVLLLVPAAAGHGAGDDHVVVFDAAAAAFPTADEVRSAIDAARGHPWAKVHELGASGEGRPLVVVEVTDPGSAVPLGERVVTLIETQQHGNEPAGTGAAVPLLRDLLSPAGADLRVLLDNQVLLLLPMSNPDGATVNTRGNRDGADINRDHIGLETPEARAIKSVLTRWDVHVAVDHHEYGGAPTGGLGNPVPVRIYDWDLTTMTPNHGNVREPTLRAAQDLNEAVWAAARAAGYSAGEYGWTTVNGVKVEQTAGGPDPGILRNAFGLSNVAGLLGETFISNQPETMFQSAERRIAIHRTVMEATLRFGHDNAAGLIAAKRESERLNVERPLADYWEPAAGTTTPEVRAPLAAAYRVPTDLAQLMAWHGLPTGVPVEGGFVHNLAGEERAGLVAAMLHPQSSRRVAEGQPTQPIEQVVPATSGSEEAALGPIMFLGLAVALAAVAARRR